jgi:DNA-binding IclR family transcriptional regulator
MTVDSKTTETALTRASEETQGDPERYIVPGLQRGLRILQLFGDERSVLRLSDVSRYLNVPRSSAFRLVYTLERMGFIERAAGGQGYRLGSRVLQLGFAYLSDIEVVEAAREPLENLRARTGLTAYLAIREGTEIVHLFRAPSLKAFSSNVPVGERRPAHATPLGRMLLCELEKDELLELYKGVRLERVTRDTVTNLRDLQRLLAEDQKRGYVISLGTYVPSGCSAATYVRDAAGRIVAAINIVGPREQSIEAELPHSLKDELLITAKEISARLGYRG